MEKSKGQLSEKQLKSYRSRDNVEMSLSFAEQLSLFSRAVKPSELGLMVQTRLKPSSATTDVLKLICDETGLALGDLRAPQYLLALSLIEEHGGGLNDGTMVVNISRPRKKARTVVPPNDAWKAFGEEPGNIAFMRVGDGVGGGIQRFTI